MLSAGLTPHTPLDEWSFTIRGAVDEPVSWSWDEFTALSSETVTVDIHCVTLNTSGLAPSGATADARLANMAALKGPV